ncbi:MAG: hypothetical protein ACREDJ_03025, partial [Methylocella sp.]
MTSSSAATDTFSATWHTPGGQFIIPETFCLVDPKNNGDCACTGEGGPINSGTGDKYQVETDFVGVPNTGLELRRY